MGLLVTLTPNLHSGLNRHKLQAMGTFRQVTHDASPSSETSATNTAAEQLTVQVHQKVALQFRRQIETHRTFGANVWLRDLVSKQMLLQVAALTELHRTQGTGEPSTFIVRLQKMFLELVWPRETFRAVFA